MSHSNQLNRTNQGRPAAFPFFWLIALGDPDRRAAGALETIQENQKKNQEGSKKFSGAM